MNSSWIEKCRNKYIENKENTRWEALLKDSSISDAGFQKEKAEQHRFSFSVELDTMKPVAQGYAGRCWIMAGLNLLREHAKNKLHAEFSVDDNFHFSAAYVCFWDKLEKAEYILNQAIEMIDVDADDREMISLLQYGVTDGGFWNYFVDLIEKYGLVPASVMPETFQSFATEEMNNRINYFVKKTIADIRRAKVEGINDVCLVSKKEEAMEKIFVFLCRCYGCPPATFSYLVVTDKEKVTKEFTPLSFYQEYLGEYINSFFSVMNLPIDKLPMNQVCKLNQVFCIRSDRSENFLNLPIDELKKLCIRQLQNGTPVVFTADDDKMCAEEKALWDDNSFDYSEMTGFDFDMDRGDYFSLKAGSACHSMLLTGVHLDETGEPLRWKIMNSYGIEGPYEGYFICSDSWFEKYIFSAVIEKKLLEAYDLEKIDITDIFRIWEIM